VCGFFHVKWWWVFNLAIPDAKTSGTGAAVLKANSAFKSDGSHNSLLPNGVSTRYGVSTPLQAGICENVVVSLRLEINKIFSAS